MRIIFSYKVVHEYYIVHQHIIHIKHVLFTKVRFCGNRRAVERPRSKGDDMKEKCYFNIHNIVVIFTISTSREWVCVDDIGNDGYKSKLQLTLLI